MPEALFSKPMAVITLASCDAMTNGYLIVERPMLITIEGEKYIRARHAKTGVSAVRGKSVLISLSHVTTITEFDVLDEIQLGQPRSGGSS